MDLAHWFAPAVMPPALVLPEATAAPRGVAPLCAKANVFVSTNPATNPSLVGLIGSLLVFLMEASSRGGFRSGARAIVHAALSGSRGSLRSLSLR
jgi:hypothetical protein